MAPELLAGRPSSIRTDLYSLGVVLLQLLTNDFRRPVAIDWAQPLDNPLLRHDLERCLAGTPEHRFAGVGQLARNLRNLKARQTEAYQHQLKEEERRRLQREAEHRRKTLIFAGCLAGVLLLVALALAYGLHQAEQARRLQLLHT